MQKKDASTIDCQVTYGDMILLRRSINMYRDYPFSRAKKDRKGQEDNISFERLMTLLKSAMNSTGRHGAVPPSEGRVSQTQRLKLSRSECDLLIEIVEGVLDETEGDDQELEILVGDRSAVKRCLSLLKEKVAR